MPQSGNREIRDKSITESKLSDSVIEVLNQSYPIVEATGTNNYIGANARIKGLTKGITRLTLFVDRDSTGNCSLNLNQFGDRNIRDSFGNIVTNMKANIPYNLCYNGTDFILQGKGGGGNVQPHEVINGKTYTSDKGPGVGTMPSNGPINHNLNAGQSVGIPAGYTPGGTITANNLANQTPANADASKILAGYNAWVNGRLVHGNAKPFIENVNIPSATLVGHVAFSMVDNLLFLGLVGNIAYLVMLPNSTSASWCKFNIDTMEFTKYGSVDTVRDYDYGNGSGIKDNIIYYRGKKFDLNFNPIPTSGSVYLTVDRSKEFIKTSNAIIIDGITYNIKPDKPNYESFYPIVFGDLIIIRTKETSTYGAGIYAFDYKSGVLKDYMGNTGDINMVVYYGNANCIYFNVSYSNKGSSRYYHDVGYKLNSNGEHARLFDFRSEGTKQLYVTFRPQINCNIVPCSGDVISGGYFFNDILITRNVASNPVFAVNNHIYAFKQYQGIYKYRIG